MSAWSARTDQSKGRCLIDGEGLPATVVVPGARAAGVQPDLQLSIRCRCPPRPEVTADPAALLAAVQAQPAPAVTATLPVPPAAGTLPLGAPMRTCSRCPG